jgi:hypothetical protein
MTSKQPRRGIDELLACSSLAVPPGAGNSHITEEAVASVLRRRAAAQTLGLMETQLDDIEIPEFTPSQSRDDPPGQWAAVDDQKSREI